MLRRALLPLMGLVLLFASCTDEQPTQTDASDQIPADLLERSLSILDGNNGDPAERNEHFFWLRPLSDVRPNSFDGVVDTTLLPTLEICPRSAEGDGCVDGPPLASFERDEGEEKNRIKLDDNGHYYAHWRMEDFPPQRDDVYRIRVVLAGQEFGHADVVVLRQREIRAYAGTTGDAVVPISDRGAFKITFRLEEGVLESQFCDFDADNDFEDCDADVEVAGDGEDTEVNVTATSSDGDQVVAGKVTAPDGVFTDENGDPVEAVVVTAEVEILPPSEDIFTDDDQELPFFVEVNTFPENVIIDPAGPGVTVVICQDEGVLAARGITTLGLMTQMVLYKVSDPKPGFPDGETERLVSTFGAPECGAAPVPAPSAQGLAALMGQGVRKLLGFVGPQPLRARRLHGGMNTVVSDSDGDAFSTFGAALGPNADSTQAVVPDGLAGDTTTVTVQVRTALGAPFALGGDTIEAEVVAGPNTGSVLSVLDEGGGVYTARYVPLAPGIDSIAINLTRNDGTDLGPIGESPFPSTVVSGPVVNTNDAGPGSLRLAMESANVFAGPSTITFAIPGAGPHVISLATPLPAITDLMTIDAETQPGFVDGAPVVRIDGAASGGTGFQVHHSNVDIRGFSITNFPGDGVFVLQGVSFVTVVGSNIGTDQAGSSGLGNGVGIRVRGSKVSVADNVISGNGGAGILVESLTSDVSDLVVQNNLIGLAPSGLAALGNGTGINMYGGSASQVVGPVIEQNRISGNGGVGVDIQHSGALQPVTGAIIRDNVIGLDAAGNVLGNGSDGLRVNNAPGTLIGEPGRENVISGNGGSGVRLVGPTVAPAPRLRGNIIGLDPGGTAARGNASDGVTVATSNVVIGGPAPGDRNIVSGNDSDGIETTGGATGVLVEGNWVGLDATGTAAVGNGFVNGGCCRTGIFVRTGGHTVRGNVVSGNWLGIRSGDPGGPANLIENNLVGTDASGTGDLGNQNDGIGLYGDKSGTQLRGNTVRFNGTGVAMVEGTQDALLGGTALGDGNVVSDNDGIGIRVGYNTGATGDTDNTIRGNSTVGNGGLGIDLAGNGVTANDALDADTGPNGLVNRPEIQTVLNTGAGTEVALLLNAAPNTAYEVELFANAFCHPSGSGEGEVSLGTFTSGTTDGSGQLLYTVTLPLQPLGTEVSATATDPAGSTSEYAACVAAASPAGIWYWDPAGGGNGHYYEYVTGSQSWTAAKAAAEGMSFGGVPGHLVTITSGAEQAFVNSIRTDSLGLPDWRPWIGLRDVTGTGGFAWVTGEPLSFTNWGGGEPNNIGSELYVEMFASGVWNNIVNSPIPPYGFLVEYPVTPPPAFTLDAILPDTAAAGFGQMVTIDGSGFPGSPTVSFTQGGTTLDGFVYSATSSRLVTRLPTSGLSASAGGVPTDVQVSGGGGFSNVVTIPVRTQPGTPLVIQLYEADWTPGAPPPGDVCGGTKTVSDGDLFIDASDAIAVQAHGLDTSGSQILLTQGADSWLLTPSCAFFAPVAVIAPLPTTSDPGSSGGFLTNGPGSVQVRTQVGGVFSDWSAPIAVNIFVPSEQ